MGELQLKTVSALSAVRCEDWDRVANPDGLPFDPFLSWDFLEAMESTGAATPETGWTPLHLLVLDQQSCFPRALGHALHAESLYKPDPKRFRVSH